MPIYTFLRGFHRVWHYFLCLHSKLRLIGHPNDILFCKYSPPCPFVPLSRVFTFHSPSRVVYGTILTLMVLWLALDTAQRGTRQVVSFFGLVFFVLVVLMFSRHPFRVRHTTPAMLLHSLNTFSNPLVNTFSFFVHTVVLEMFVVGDRTTVCLGPDNLQDPLRGRGTEVVGRSSRGTLCRVDRLGKSKS